LFLFYHRVIDFYFPLLIWLKWWYDKLHNNTNINMKAHNFRLWYKARDTHQELLQTKGKSEGKRDMWIEQK